MNLNIGSRELPLDALTVAFGIIGRRGSGKTHTASVLAEEFIGNHLPVTILDPLGVWWGLRSSADGEHEGLPVTILGGAHGDVPLEATAGTVVADLIVSHPGAYVLDLSGFESKSAERRFATDFAVRLYRAKVTDSSAMHLIIDEADVFAPQQAPDGDKVMLGAFEAIARRGRIRGLAPTFITQRPAVLNKNVLSQVECLIAHQVTAPQDRKALQLWAEGNGSSEEVKTFTDSLASLQVGEAWLWSPTWLQTFERVSIRRRKTFDSSATPKAGEVRTEPRVLAPVDLDALREAMAATIVKAEQDNPKKLRAEIARLRRELETRPVADCGHEDIISTLTADLERHAADLGRIRLGLRDLLGPAATLTQQIETILGAQSPAPAQFAAASLPPVKVLEKVVMQPPRTTAPVSTDLTKAERAILTALAQYPQGRTRRQVGILTGYSAKSGGFNGAIASLRTKGYVTPREPLLATPDGIDALGEFDALPTGAALLDHWCTQLDKAPAAILRTLAEAYPSAMTREEVAGALGYSANSGGFNGALAKLRTLELIERGTPRLSDDLASTGVSA